MNLGMSGDVARVLRVSRTRVRFLVLDGRLRPVEHTIRGVSLFDMADVERLRAERAARAVNSLRPRGQVVVEDEDERRAKRAATVRDGHRELNYSTA